MLQLLSKAIGNDKAIIFGGGIISLELAAVKLEVIDFLIVHEPPVIEGIYNDELYNQRLGVAGKDIVTFCLIEKKAELLTSNLFSHRCAYSSMDMYFYVY